VIGGTGRAARERIGLLANTRMTSVSATSILCDLRIVYIMLQLITRKRNIVNLRLPDSKG
jgi:hypothetical protein